MKVPEALLLAVTTLVLVVVPSLVTAGSTKSYRDATMWTSLPLQRAMRRIPTRWT